MLHKCLHPTLVSVYDTFLTKPRNFAVDMFIVFHTKRRKFTLFVRRKPTIPTIHFTKMRTVTSKGNRKDMLNTKSPRGIRPAVVLPPLRVVRSHRIPVNRGYCTAVQRYEFYFRVVKQHFTKERSEWVKYCFLPRENKIHIFKHS